MCLAVPTRTQRQIDDALHDANTLPTPCDSDTSSSPDMTPEECNIYAIPDGIYTYFEVDPPADRRLQCACAHTRTRSDLLNPDHDQADDHLSISDDMEEDDADDGLYTLRCTNVATERDYALGWRLCQPYRPSGAIIQSRVYALAVFISAID